MCRELSEYFLATHEALPALLAMAADAARWDFARDNWHNLCTCTGITNGDYGVTEVLVATGVHESFAPGTLDAATDKAIADTARQGAARGEGVGGA
jgi:hypothetical protein